MIARISHDSLYALHEVAYHLDNFVWQIETYPDLCCVVGNVNALQELQGLMKTEDKHNGQTILSYDITRLLPKNGKS